MNEKEVYEEARKKLAERFGTSTKVGGKGTEKRKIKVIHKAANDDKKVKGLVKKMNAQPMPDIIEMNFFHKDNTVWQFKNPEVFVSFQNQVIILSGPHDAKPIKDCLADVITQISADQLEFIKKVQGTAAPKDAKEKEAEIPNLVNFEEAAKTK